MFQAGRGKPEWASDLQQSRRNIVHSQTEVCRMLAEISVGKEEGPTVGKILQITPYTTRRREFSPDCATWRLVRTYSTACFFRMLNSISKPGVKSPVPRLLFTSDKRQNLPSATSDALGSIFPSKSA